MSAATCLVHFGVCAAAANVPGPPAYNAKGALYHSRHVEKSANVIDRGVIVAFSLLGSWLVVLPERLLVLPTALSMLDDRWKQRDDRLLRAADLLDR